MQDYYQKSIRALQLAGMSERTQQFYTRSVRQLVDFYCKTPDKIAEPELEDYFLHRKNKDLWSPATMRLLTAASNSFLSTYLSATGICSNISRPKDRNEQYHITINLQKGA